MKRVWLVAMTVACQRGAASDPYAQDVANICDVVRLSGATGMASNDMRFVTAKWFGENLKTEAAHQFLVRINPLQGEAKAEALEAEARRVGLDGCALAAEWRK
jgi:hypothetical protein